MPWKGEKNHQKKEEEEEKGGEKLPTIKKKPSQKLEKQKKNAGVERFVLAQEKLPASPRCGGGVCHFQSETSSMAARRKRMGGFVP